MNTVVQKRFKCKDYHKEAGSLQNIGNEVELASSRFDVDLKNHRTLIWRERFPVKAGNDETKKSRE